MPCIGGTSSGAREDSRRRRRAAAVPPCACTQIHREPGTNLNARCHPFRISIFAIRPAVMSARFVDEVTTPSARRRAPRPCSRSFGLSLCAAGRPCRFFRNVLVASKVGTEAHLREIRSRGSWPRDPRAPRCLSSEAQRKLTATHGPQRQGDLLIDLNRSDFEVRPPRGPSC